MPYKIGSEVGHYKILGRLLHPRTGKLDRRYAVECAKGHQQELSDTAIRNSAKNNVPCQICEEEQRQERNYYKPGQIVGFFTIIKLVTRASYKPSRYPELYEVLCPCGRTIRKTKGCLLHDTGCNGCQTEIKTRRWRTPKFDPEPHDVTRKRILKERFKKVGKRYR